MEITIEERKKLIEEAYDWQREQAKIASPDKKEEAVKKKKKCSVYANRYNIGRMSIFKFCEVINRYHPYIRFIIKMTTK